MDDILEITPPNLPFDPDAKIFNVCDDDGNTIGDPYSYNDFIQKITDISGVSDELVG